MIRRPPRSTRTDTLFPYTTLFRALLSAVLVGPADGRHRQVDVGADVDRLELDGHGGCTIGVPSDPENASKSLISVSSRSEEHTSELQSLMRISYAVFCFKQKTTHRSECSTTTSDHNQKLL